MYAERAITLLSLQHQREEPCARESLASDFLFFILPIPQAKRLPLELFHAVFLPAQFSLQLSKLVFLKWVFSVLRADPLSTAGAILWFLA